MRYDIKEMLYPMEKPVLVDGIRDIVGCRLYLLIAVAHGDAYGCIADHGDVVITVPYGGGLFPGESPVFQDLFDAQPFATALWGDVAEGETGGEGRMAVAI